MINKYTLLLLFFSMGLPLMMQATPSSGEPDSLHILKGVFDFPEITVLPSPASEKSILLQDIEKVVDYDVSPEESMVAAILKGKNQQYRIVFWKVGEEKLVDCWNSPSGYIPTAIVWHPLGTQMFVIVAKETTYHIFRIDKKDNQWTSKSIFSSPNQLKRLVVCPRPFVISSDSGKEYYSYRIFFGMGSESKSFRIVSITENGSRFYQVIGPAATKTKEFPDSYVPPSEITSDFALPLSFHPAGHELIWEDNQHQFNIAIYNNSYWGGSKPFSDKTLSGGSITPTPNGLAFIHWQKDHPGIGLYNIKTGKEKQQLQNIEFIATPSSVPDGKGIVGLMKTEQGLIFSYQLIDIPLADVQNAWMFTGSKEEMDLLQKNYGLFRNLDFDQLYQLYDTENYACGDYDRRVPTRPYLVTTDIFWELFASAYEGIFIISERDQAIPNFWKFVDATNHYYRTKTDTSPWASVFKALSDLHAGNQQNPEVARMIKAEGVEESDILKKEFNYGELKPRSHYTATDEMKKYFMGFKYFTTVYDTSEKILEELNVLPQNIRNYAFNWINSYKGFIAPSRSNLVWTETKNNIPAYTHYPNIFKTIFPLSWGFDNEVLYSTVYHEDVPEELQVRGPGGLRLLPSGLDLAATLGNGMAEFILKDDFDKYPPLKKVIANLQSNFKATESEKGEEKNLYDQWINALSVQWTDTLRSVNNNLDRNLWQLKRLNTGLASWATLRHATGLVNERTVAECGEAGFEAIILRAPRGYAEPDPYTFEAIADLFETTIKYLPAETSSAPGIHESYEEAKGSLYAGITKRLKEMAESARKFKSIAEKERRGQVLSSDEYEEILYVGRIAEHYFLIFKSLSNPDYALSTPDPMSKIADVAGDRSTSYLHSAVGNPLEWDYVVPFYGRHEIVKGSVYSYYEFISEKLLDDNDWRIKLKNQPFLPWISPYVTDQSLSYPASSGY